MNVIEAVRGRRWCMSTHGGPVDDSTVPVDTDVLRLPRLNGDRKE